MMSFVRDINAKDEQIQSDRSQLRLWFACIFGRPRRPDYRHRAAKGQPLMRLIRSLVGLTDCRGITQFPIEFFGRLD